MIEPRNITDPSLDARDDVAIKAGMPEMIDKIWFHKTATAVIDSDRCVRCGSCIAACPSHSIGVDTEGLPSLIKMCTGCSACWDFCPLGGLRPERLWKLEEKEENSAGDPLGRVRAVYGARDMERDEMAQDGGVVTAILEELLKSGEITGALVTERNNAFQGRAKIARTVEEIRAGAGSIYEQSVPLGQFSNLPDVGPDERLAMVGTPCQITGSSALKKYGWNKRRTVLQAVKYSIGLLCSRSFDSRKLLVKLAKGGVKISDVNKIDIAKGKLYALDKGGNELLAEPVKDFHDVSLRGCDECADFTARLSDISVGNMGSSPGYSTLIIRTESGENAWDLARHRFDMEDAVNMEPIRKLERRNRESAVKSLKRDFNEDAPMWIHYSEHLKDYIDTDRTPVKSPPRRSFNYAKGTVC